MKQPLALSLLLLFGCTAPDNNPTSMPTSRKVAYQPPPMPVPKPLDGQPGVYPTTVELVIDGAGRVSEVIPKGGSEPYLSTTVGYAKQWRFTPNFPTTPGALVPLSITYTWGASRTIDISIKP